MTNDANKNVAGTMSSEATASEGSSVAKVTLSEKYERAIEAFIERDDCRFIVDTSSDFDPALRKRLGIQLVSFAYVTPEGERLDDLWESQTPHEFYEYLRENPTVHYSTSAITPGRYLEAFEEAAKEGKPAIFLSLPSTLSTSFNNAERAAEMLRETYPDFELYVIDSLCESAAIELLVLEAIYQMSEGLSPKETVAWIEEARHSLRGYFMLDNLDSLAAGGRIPPKAAQLGSMLDIKPSLTYEDDGKLTLRGAHRGRRKALRAVLQDFRDTYDQDTSRLMAIVSTDSDADGDWLEQQVRKIDGLEDVVILRNSVSSVLGSHVGPDMVGFTFWATDRREKASLADRLAKKVRGA